LSQNWHTRPQAQRSGLPGETHLAWRLCGSVVSWNAARADDPPADALMTVCRHERPRCRAGRARTAADAITFTRFCQALSGGRHPRDPARLLGLAAVPVGTGALLLVWIGLFALFRGISEIVIAFEVRSRQRG
jgi:hypothetical protein